MIDLGTQAEAVTRRVQDWTKPQILAWLRQHGEVLEPHAPDPPFSGLTMEEWERSGPSLYHYYLFRSWFGILTWFRFRSDGTFDIRQ